MISSVGSLIVRSVKASHFSNQEMRLIIEKKVSALVIEDFINGKNLEVAQAVLSGYHRKTQSLSKDLGYFGFEPTDFKDGVKNPFYRGSALKSLEVYRKSTFPYLSWFDHLKKILKDSHEGGIASGLPHSEPRGSFIVRAMDDKDPSTLRISALTQAYTPWVAKLILLNPENRSDLLVFPKIADRHFAKKLYEKKVEINRPSSDAIGKIGVETGSLILLQGDMPHTFTRIKGKLPLVFAETHLHITTPTLPMQVYL